MEDKAIYAAIGAAIGAVLQWLAKLFIASRSADIEIDKVELEKHKVQLLDAQSIREELRSEVSKLYTLLRESEAKAEKCMTDFYTLRDEHVKFKEEYSLMKIENNSTKAEYLKMAKRLSAAQKEIDTLKGKVGKLENGSAETYQ